jgi:ferredoxin
VPTEPPDARKQNWAETDHSYSPPAALAEARRCMNCGAGAEVLVDKCAACLTCLRVCPFGIPKVTDVARIESTLCQSCGICIAECPANAIVSRSDKPAQLTAKVSAALAGEGPRSVAFVCGYKAGAEQWKGDANLPGLTEVYVPSVAGIRVMDLMGAFEKGAHRVLVIAARTGDNRYPQENARIRRRVQQAKDLLREAGVDAERLKLVELTVS